MDLRKQCLNDICGSLGTAGQGSWLFLGPASDGVGVYYSTTKKRDLDKSSRQNFAVSIVLHDSCPSPTHKMLKRTLLEI